MHAERAERTNGIEHHALNRSVRGDHKQNADAAEDVERWKICVVDLRRRQPARTRPAARPLPYPRTAGTPHLLITAAHGLFRIDPVERVVDPGPRQAAGRSAARVSLLIQKESERVAIRFTGMKIDVARNGRTEAPHLACLKIPGLIGHHHLDGLRLQNLFLIRPEPLAQNHLRELDVVRRGRVQSAAAVVGFRRSGHRCAEFL